ncbi:phage tail protein [Acidisoma cellulosilytica]|uniref:Phage tail protein n=1 Tax=Acidisoma cellulosilyticum TaxID=2802395 RepID=A0A964E377_9PROT|nr:phage tail protein [Acidisoma cellulosilyticum]MCB8880410.1 phage tail protein [Acidisoma cellulosilyticum]
MPIVQQGAINTTALVVPDLYVQIVPPQTLLLNGVPTDILGIVGSASWGPVGQPVIIGSMAQYASAFGPVMPRLYDMGTPLATAVQQGAQNFRCVRVTDGTDAAAALTVQTAITLTAIHTGSYGNGISVSLSAGSQSGSTRITVALPGNTPEVFDNITGSGAALWQAMVLAINTGNGPLRGASQVVTAIYAGGTAAPVAGTFSFLTGTPGADGATNVAAANLIGSDTMPRTGMYALRGQGCSVALLADASDSTQYTVQAEFGLSEGIYMILTGPSGDTTENAVSTKAAAGLDSYAAKLMFGDWIYWNDQVNAQLRLVSPQGFAAGRLINLSPDQSSLNKQLYSIAGSQRSGTVSSGQTSTYSSAELQLLFQNGIDVICNPQPGGSYWGVRCGHNSSSNAAVNGDNYTRMTNYIAATLSAGMGLYVGQVINSTLFQNIRATLLSFLQAMLTEGLLASTDGSQPFSVACDNSNNPASRTALGYVQADVQVQYQGINEKFIVNVEGGQTVQITSQTLASGPNS